MLYRESSWRFCKSICCVLLRRLWNFVWFLHSLSIKSSVRHIPAATGMWTPPPNSYTPIDALLLPEWIIYWDRKFGFVRRGSLQNYSLLAPLQTQMSGSRGYEVFWFARSLIFSRFCWSHPQRTTERNSYLKVVIIVMLWKCSEILLCPHAALACRASQAFHRSIHIINGLYFGRFKSSRVFLTSTLQ